MTVPTVDVELGQAFAASDDALRDSPLSATLAMRTILSWLVMRRSRGFIRPRRDLGDWLALVHFDDGGVSESYLLKTYAQRRCDFQNEALSQSLARLKSTIAEVAPGALSSSQRSVATVPVVVNSSTCGHACTGFTSLRASTQSQMNPSGFALQSDLF